MKKPIIAICLLCFSFNTALQAQETNKVQIESTVAAPTLHRAEFGIRFMPTFSSFQIQTADGKKISGEATFGFGVGAMMAFNLSSHVGIQAEAIYNSLSQKYTDQNMDRKITLNYLNVPLLLSLNTGKSRPVNLNVVVGPQFGINVGSKVSGPVVDTVATNFSVKRNDIGLAYGAGLEFALNGQRTLRLDMGYRGVYGFSNVSNTEGTSLLIRSDAVYVGFAYLF